MPTIEFEGDIKLISEANARSNRKRLPPIDQIWREYQETGSVHRVAKRYKTTGETVRKRLMEAGYDTSRNAWSEEELSILREWYETHTTDNEFELDKLAQLLGRLKSNVSRKARALGLTDMKRKKSETRKGPRPNKFSSKEELARFTGERLRQHFKENGHPRGMLGKKHKPETIALVVMKNKQKYEDGTHGILSDEYRQRSSDRLVERNKANGFPMGKFGYSRGKSGKRADLEDRYFRSRWEANYARYLNWLVERGEIKEWDYECQTFYFEKIKRGTRSYTPDFKVVANDGSYVWHEVKGYMDQPSRTRLRRFAKYYPNEKLIVIDAEWFKSAVKSGIPGIVANWEYDTSKK